MTDYSNVAVMNILNILNCSNIYEYLAFVIYDYLMKHLVKRKYLPFAKTKVSLNLAGVLIPFVQSSNQFA